MTYYLEQERDPALAAQLIAMKPRSTSLWGTLVSQSKWIMSFLFYLPILAVVSMIPGINFLVKFMWQLYNLNKWLEMEVATVIAVLSVLPPTEFIVSWGVQAFLAQVFLAQQLLYPYFSRVNLDKR